jgi:hypothetical protein
VTFIAHLSYAPIYSLTGQLPHGRAPMHLLLLRLLYYLIRNPAASLCPRISRDERYRRYRTAPTPSTLSGIIVFERLLGLRLAFLLTRLAMHHSTKACAVHAEHPCQRFRCVFPHMSGLSCISGRMAGMNIHQILGADNSGQLTPYLLEAALIRQ